MGQVEALASVGLVRRPGRAFVERHHDVGADGAFDVNDPFGGEEMFAAVDVTAELAAFFGEFANAGEGEDLEASAVGQHRAGEAVEAMESADALQHLRAGAEIEVIGVSENDFRLQVVNKFAKVNALHAADGTDGHEDGRVNHAVICREQSGASASVFLCVLQVIGHFSESMRWILPSLLRGW